MEYSVPNRFSENVKINCRTISNSSSSLSPSQMNKKPKRQILETYRHKKKKNISVQAHHKATIGDMVINTKKILLLGNRHSLLPQIP